MLGYVIALMVAWPIVGYVLIWISAIYWTVQGIKILGANSEKLDEYVNMFDASQHPVRMKITKKIRFETTANPEASKKEKVLNELANYIRWPITVYAMSVRGRAACEHFKSET